MACILIVAPKERKVRIEVGRGLEGTLTDALSKIIIENAILPRFREGDFAGGIKNGVRDIALVLTGDAAEVEARAKARNDADNPLDRLDRVHPLDRDLAVDCSTASGAACVMPRARVKVRPARFSFPARAGAAAAAGAVAAAVAAEVSRAAAGASAAAAPRVDGSAMATQPFTAEDQAAISEAITRAEQKTSGEIVVVAAIASDGYRSFGVLWAALVALAVPLPLMFATKWPVQYIYLLQIAVFLALPGAVPMGSASASLWCRAPSSAPAPINAPSSSSWCRTCTPPRAAPAC